MENWIFVNDHKIRHLWECPECDRKVYVWPWSYSENGTPICEDCDEDMIYCSTEYNNV